MLASKELITAINTQVGNEFGASLQYVSIASYFDTEALTGLARFFYRQADEERAHAMKFVQFVVDAGVAPGYPLEKHHLEQIQQVAPDAELIDAGQQNIAQEAKDFGILKSYHIQSVDEIPVSFIIFLAWWL